MNDKQPITQDYYKNAATSQVWIVGSITEDGKSLSFSSTPVIHYSEAAAQTEAARLAKLHTGKRFMWAQLGGSVVVGGLTWN